MVITKTLDQKVLFVTYDGLRDPLGQSQVLPYIRIISSHVKYLHILSFEKKKIKKNEKIILPNNVGWTKCKFSYGGTFSKFIDLLKMIFTTYYLCKKYKFNIVHARSYPSMHATYLLKKIFKYKSVFDMRGFWVDDRVDGNIWPQNTLKYRLLFKYYKNLEKKFLQEADIIVILTKKAKVEIEKISKSIQKKIYIIPCCADYKHFQPLNLVSKNNIKNKLNIKEESTVISYLGSIGTVYLFDQMIKFFNEVLSNNKNEEYIFLVITKQDKKNIEKKIFDLGYKQIIKNIRIVSALRSEVPKYLGISDLMLTLRMPSYSQIAASPTKIGEAFSMGIPVISNKGIGDTDEIIKKFNAGVTFDINSQIDFKNVVNSISIIKKKGGEKLRKQTEEMFSLINANKLYRDIYKSLYNDRV